MSIKETMSRIQRDLDESLAGNQIGPKGPPKLSVPPHMSDYTVDNSQAARARQAEQDRNRFGAPPKATKP
jgi:hypothetical protein